MRSWLPFALVTLVIFILTRLAPFALGSADSDVHLYARYADEWHTAAAEGKSFYQLHRQRIEAEMQRDRPVQSASLAEYKQVEYPPLAVAWMALAGGPDTYVQHYLSLMAVLDVVLVLLVIWLVRRLFPDESAFEQCQRWLVYILCSWPLYAVLYTRLDLGVAVLVTAALALLASQRHWVFALAVLALAIHFKLMPVVLAPLWLIGTLPVTMLQAPWRVLARALAWRSVLLAGLALAMLAPFYLWEGPAVFDFLAYHQDRGIEIESTYATLPLLLQHAGQPYDVYHSHGSVNVRSPLTPLLTASAMVVMALLLLAALAGFAWALRCWQRQQSGPGDAGRTVAQACPRLVAASALVLLSISIAANKVFSVQYLIWVLPLATLIDFPPWQRRLFFVALLTVSVLTMRIFPDCFVGEIVYVVNRDQDAVVFGGPTTYGALLLFARNGLFVALTAWVASRLRPCPPVLVGRQYARRCEHLCWATEE